jgi:hypothetical protein
MQGPQLKTFPPPDSTHRASICCCKSLGKGIKPWQETLQDHKQRASALTYIRMAMGISPGSSAILLLGACKALPFI